MIDLLKKNGKFFKANLHCHTVNSDGKMTPEQVKAHYKTHGYSIVAFTDHNKFINHKHLNDNDFLAIGGIENAFHFYEKNGVATRTRTCHLNFYAKNPETAEYITEEMIYSIGNINAYIKKMTNSGWLCTLNHPAWSQQPTEDVNAIQGITAMEVYNNGCEVLYNCGKSQDYFRSYLANGNRIFSVATDDNHCSLDENGEVPFNDDSLGGYINISMPSLTYENFIDAFENGRFYPSTGVEIKELYIDEDTDELVIECSPVQTVIIKGTTCSSRGVTRICTKGNDVTSARISMSGIREKYPHFTVELRTTDGKIAYSQPYYLDK
ncbi:MAG: PHP domain-containing protein [Clostridia bacterium]|nr:PHP domain-containing protein [Clostridia bacterium]